MRLAAVAVAAVLITSAYGVQAATATVDLPQDAVTSAGIFDFEGRLVKTLWRGRKHSAGRVSLNWDGTSEDARPATDPKLFSARLLAHNVKYVWEGVIGNTSRVGHGPGVHRAFHPIHDMAIDAAGNAFYAVGYNEQQPAMHRFHVSDPQIRVPLAKDDYQRVFRHVATDGSLVYFANAAQAESFVIAMRVADGRAHSFPDGRLVFDGVHHGNRWDGVIDYERDERRADGSSPRAPGGLAVQRKGDILFVSHPGLAEIRLYHKRSGALLGRIAVEGATDMDVAPDDSLWVLCKPAGVPTVARYRPQRSEWARDRTITEGLRDPLAIGVSARDGWLIVVDGGSEQLKSYDKSGRPLRTFGRAGGYRDGEPTVANDRFWFSIGPTYLAFQADGSFWVGDPGNARNLHFDRDLRYLEQIMFMPVTYVTSVDPNQPSRVFAGLLEFAVDYRRPIRDSWTLVRNWGAGEALARLDAFRGIAMVTTLGNGRTYGLQVGMGPDRRLVELTPAGVRKTRVRLDPGLRLYPDGGLRRSRSASGWMHVHERKLLGFDANADPQWGPYEEIARAPAVANVDPAAPGNWFVDPAHPTTASGVVVSFNPTTSGGFHLGGIAQSGMQWQWRTSPTGRWPVDGKRMVVGGDGSFETGRGVHYPGSMVMAAGSEILFGYHGEAWNSGQANQWMHYQDDGLFVGQFGTPAYPDLVKQGAIPGTAGNAFSPALVKVSDALYLWHNDESVHGGVHRWRIDGLSTVQRLSAPILPQ